MKHSKNAGFGFIALAAAFFAIGINNQSAFLVVAIAFLAIGISYFVRSKRAKNVR